MEQENVDVQEEVVEQEEGTTTDEETQDEGQEGTQDDGNITISKEKFKAMQRKSIAYDALNKPKAPQAPKKEKISNSDSDPKIERLELKIEGYPDEIVDKIMELGGKKSLSNPIIKKATDDMLEQYKAEKATKIQSSSQSDFERKYSEADLKGKSLSELEKILPHADE